MTPFDIYWYQEFGRMSGLDMSNKRVNNFNHLTYIKATEDMPMDRKGVIKYGAEN